MPSAIAKMLITQNIRRNENLGVIIFHRTKEQALTTGDQFNDEPTGDRAADALPACR